MLWLSQKGVFGPYSPKGKLPGANISFAHPPPKSRRVPWSPLGPKLRGPDVSRGADFRALV